jgi:hypothetical protein
VDTRLLAGHYKEGFDGRPLFKSGVLCKEIIKLWKLFIFFLFPEFFPLFLQHE